MLLAALSGEHILFIGPPGTAKSELGRRLSYLYQGTFFERLLTRFSVPEVMRDSQKGTLSPSMHYSRNVRDKQHARMARVPFVRLGFSSGNSSSLAKSIDPGLRKEEL